MAFQDLTLRDWERFSDVQARDYIGSLAAALPQDLRVAGLSSWTYAGRTQRIARFIYNDALFVLIPGCEAQLGYDASRFQPSLAQRESYQASADEYEIALDIYAFVDAMTRAPEAAQLAPFLLEAQPSEIGLEPILPDEPMIRELLERHDSQQIESYKRCRVRRNPDGTVEAWRIRPTRHADIVRRLAADGMRLPSSDEWEYACGGGSATLFRWGDTCPCDRYPLDNTADEARRKRDWALSGGTIAFEPDAPDWDLHLRPNQFGLTIAQNPYHYEAVADPAVLRGGDGGSSMCGGAGFFLSWLSLATAYWDTSYRELMPKDVKKFDLSNSFMRRLIPIG